MSVFEEFLNTAQVLFKRSVTAETPPDSRFSTELRNKHLFAWTAACYNFMRTY
ncbi:MAG: hypothetical protein OEM63_08490 [Gammaproteobacteria bacterium]|nr:hypothetical protein [Gammaproteobacteria bacterium]